MPMIHPAWLIAVLVGMACGPAHQTSEPRAPERTGANASAVIDSAATVEPAPSMTTTPAPPMTTTPVPPSPSPSPVGAQPQESNARGKLIPIDSDRYGGISWAATAAPKLGSIAPVFELPTADGQRFRSRDALQSGPLIVVFYRGFW